MRSIFGIFLVLLMAMPHGFAQLNSYSRSELAFDNALTGYNPGFESGTVKWTASGGTFAVNSGTQFVPGSKQFASWDSNSASQEVCSALVKVPESGNCAVSLTYKVPSGTATHKIVAKDGSKDLSVEDVVSSTAAWRHDVEFPCAAAASNQARVCIRSVASNEPAIQLDGGYAGQSRTIGQCGIDTPAVSFTPSGSWTNNTTYSGKWWRRGDRYHYEFQVALSGAPNSTSLTVARAPGLTIDTSKLVSTTTDGRKLEGKCKIRSAGVTYNGDIYYNGTSNTAVVVQNVASTYPFSSNVTQSLPGTFTNGDAIICEGSVPIVGWEASQCVTPEQQRAPKITTYLSGSGTHTWSNGVTYAEVEIVGAGGSGVGSGSASWGAANTGNNTTFGDATANGGSPGNTTSGGTASGGGGGSCTLGSVTGMCIVGGGGGGATYGGGSYSRGGQGGTSCLGVGAHSSNLNSQPNPPPLNSGGGGSGAGIAGNVTHTAGAGGGAGGCIRGFLVAPSGTTAYSIGAAVNGGSAGTGGAQGGNSAAGRIRITEYFGYTTAILANSVSSSVTNGARMIWASVKSTCSASPCTINTQSGDFTSITRSGTGSYQANFNAGTFSAAPVCTCSSVGALDATCSAYGSNTSNSTVRTYTPTGSSQDGYIEMMCIGPR